MIITKYKFQGVEYFYSEYMLLGQNSVLPFTTKIYIRFKQTLKSLTNEDSCSIIIIDIDNHNIFSRLNSPEKTPY